MGTQNDWLNQDGMPSRPFEDSGTLVKPLRTPRTASVIFAACERQLLVHLKAACLWPESQRDKAWRIGDYSDYLLEFSPAPGTIAYVQFWSEPDEDGVIIATRDAAENLDRSVAIGAARNARTLGREAVAILCKRLGYDGRVPLAFRLRLGTRLKAGLVFESICASDLVKLLRRWGYVAEIDGPDGRSNLVGSAVGAHPFLVASLGTTARLQRIRHDRAAGVLPLRRRRRAPYEHDQPGPRRASVDEEGDLIRTVTDRARRRSAENLRMNFGIWKQTIEEIVSGLN
jgi:hypothetical protein